MDKVRIEGLELFKSLTKTGCIWHGDILSNKWSEELFFLEELREKVLQDLDGYEEGIHYRLLQNSIYII